MKRPRVTNSNYNPCEICQEHCPYFINHHFAPCLTVAGYNRAMLLEDMLGDEYDLENLLNQSTSMDVTIPHFNIGDIMNPHGMSLKDAIRVLEQYQGFAPMDSGITLRHSFDLDDETVCTILFYLKGAYN